MEAVSGDGMFGSRAAEPDCPKAPPGQTEFLVSVPPGTAPGALIQTGTPDGQVLTFNVPQDFVDGQVIPVFYTPLAGRAPQQVIGPEMPPDAPPKQSKAEIRLLMHTFKDARDRWKIDGQTMKCFYLHTQTGYLYTWDQPTGVLYEYEQSSGQCRVVWKSALPAINAEIWQVLPLPPTDPSSMQSQQSENGYLPNIDAFLILTIAHESGHQLPRDVLEAAADEFVSQQGLHSRASQRLRKLSPAAQHFVLQNFRSDAEQGRSEEFLSYVDKLLRRSRPPWGNSACTLLVRPEGAILGRCCPDLDALCRQDPAQRLAQAHCKIKSDQDRFFVCDLGTSTDGTELDGFVVGEEWVGPLKTGNLLAVGPLRIKIQLSDMAKDTPIKTLKRGSNEDEPGEWQTKVYQGMSKEDRLALQKRQQEYKDRAEERRKRTKGEAGSVAIDSLINRFHHIVEAEKSAQEAEDGRVEMPTMQAHRELNMGTDGSFLGSGGCERAGIGFQSQMGASLIPNVLDPRSLPAKDAKQMKMQMRYEQAHG